MASEDALERLNRRVASILNCDSEDLQELASVAELDPRSAFQGANLESANLSYANLRDFNLSRANLRNANLSNADLRGVALVEANLSKANLSKANLSKANLSKANLSRANLSDARLRDAKLAEADLSAASIPNTDFSSADISNARVAITEFDGATFRGTLTKGAHLSRELGTYIGRRYRPKVPPTRVTRHKSTAVRDPFTKSQLIATIAENAGLTKKDVAAVLEALSGIIYRHLKKRAVGQFTLPGLLKIKTSRKPATRARKGINPFTGEETVFKAKSARTVVKVQPLSNLRAMVEE